MFHFLHKKAGGAKKTFYMHIGFSKTGTTSIQTFLSENSKWMAERGMHWVGDLHQLHDNDISTLEKLSFALQNSLQYTLEQFLTSPLSSGVVSSEFFPQFINNDKQLKWVRDNFATTVVAVVRNQVAMDEAGYQQAVKGLSLGGVWGCPAPQDYQGYCEGNFLDGYASIFGEDAVAVLPYDFLNEKDGLLQTFVHAIGLPDLSGSSLPKRQNEGLGYDYFLFLQQSLFLPLPMDIRRALCENLIDLSGKSGEKRSFLIIPRENHLTRLRLREHELRYVGKEFLHIPDWFEYCQSYLEKQKDAPYTELPLEKQRVIFDQLPSVLQEALDKAMPDSLKPKLLPPLPTDSASYALMTAWVKNSVVQLSKP